MQKLTLETLATAYLEICQNECRGDRSVGIPACEFYSDLDVDKDGNPIQSFCMLEKLLDEEKQKKAAPALIPPPAAFLYVCNPARNVACTKQNCYLYGGQCRHTSHFEYAMDGGAVPIPLADFIDFTEQTRNSKKVFPLPTDGETSAPAEPEKEA